MNRAFQAAAEDACHKDSMHGRCVGSSLISTAPLRLVSVHRLQSYSKEAQLAADLAESHASVAMCL